MVSAASMLGAVVLQHEELVAVVIQKALVDINLVFDVCQGF